MKDVAVSADGVPVQFEVESGDGPPLVFVHGWSCDRTYWRQQLSHFPGRHQVVAIDLAGHGESGSGRTAWTMPAFGGDVVAVIEKLELLDPVLVGHSMGGDVIVEAALLLPGRVSGLVWVDTYSTLGEPRTQAELEEFIRPFRDDFVTATHDFLRLRLLPGADQRLVEWVSADMSAAPPEIALDAMRHAIGNDDAILSALEERTAPVVAINPDHRPTDIEALRRYGLEAVLMSGVRHFPMLEDPDTFNRRLRETIAGMR
jgi:pimeloyl-ACP methyl ester carboxylesterase